MYVMIFRLHYFISPISSMESASSSGSSGDEYISSSEDDVIDVVSRDGPRTRHHSENAREQVVIEDADNGTDLGSMDMFALSWRSQVTPASVSTVHFYLVLHCI